MVINSRLKFLNSFQLNYFFNNNNYELLTKNLLKNYQGKEEFKQTEGISKIPLTKKTRNARRRLSMMI